MTADKLAWHAIAIAATAADPTRLPGDLAAYGAPDHLSSLISHELSRDADDRQLWQAIVNGPRTGAAHAAAARVLQAHMAQNPPFRRALIHALKVTIASAGRQSRHRRTPRCRAYARP